MTIRNRITLWFTLLVLGLLLIDAALGWAELRGRLRQEMHAMLAAKADGVQLLLDAQPRGGSTAELPRDFPMLLQTALSRPQPDADLYLQLRDLDGRRLMRTANLKQMLPLLVSGAYQPYDLPIGGDLANGESRRVMVYARSLRLDGRPLALVQIALPMETLGNELLRYTFFKGFSLLVIGILTLALARLLSRRALSPMVMITHKVQEMGGEDLDNRVDLDPAAPEEIHELATTFNGLLDRISEAFARQEQFIADASHELRSPLTVIRGNAQLVRKRGREHPEIFDECLDNMLEETQRLERLVTDLLMLARSRSPLSQHQPLDLILLIRQTAQTFQPLHPQIQLQLPETPLWIEGDPDGLKRVLINLIDNALRVIDSQGRIEIACRQLGEQAEVSVQDNGTGIEPQHLPHLFDRFYRVDTARSRAGGGSGLGLAISRQILEAHQGRIAVHSQLGRGSRFVFWLPLLSEDGEESLPAQRQDIL